MERLIDGCKGRQLYLSDMDTRRGDIVCVSQASAGLAGGELELRMLSARIAFINKGRSKDS